MVYNIKEKVSDIAGRKLAVYKAQRGYTNSQALDEILSNLPAREYEPKENKGD